MDINALSNPFDRYLTRRPRLTLRQRARWLVRLGDWSDSTGAQTQYLPAGLMAALDQTSSAAGNGYAIAELVTRVEALLAQRFRSQ